MEADFIVVGAGSAGCAMAYRLAEAGSSVIVVEFGGSDAGPFIRMPAALSYPMNMARYDWGYKSMPEPGLGGRRLVCPRGKVIGGSSSINGMVYVRGHPGDFAAWESLGARGWGYGDVAPYFRRMETFAGTDSSGLRGTDGPLHVRPAACENPLVQAFLAAGREAGFPITPDYNGADQEGFGPMQATIHQGRRWSAADAFLRPAMKTGRCRLVRGLVERVRIENGRATGVELAGKDAPLVAHREVILAAGAINSPKLLMLSGVGPGAHLRDMGIDVAVDRPGVGANLQDHLEVYVQAASTAKVSLYRYWSLLGKARVGAEWLLRRSGPGASNQLEGAAFLRSGPGVGYPDVQFHFLPIAVRYDGHMAHKGHGFQIHTGPMRSESRGHVRLAGPDPQAAPAIFFNYMSAPNDWAEFRAAIRLARKVIAQPALAQLTDFEIQPGAHVQTDDAIDAFVRDHAESAYHPCGTCRMGAAEDKAAVVDPETRVIGVAGLRVADSSIFPRITNGNLNAPSIMVGEKAADHILGRGLLPRVDANALLDATAA